MKAQTLRDYLSVHTWVGIVSGLLLFIAFYAGAFSMLEPEITRWTQPPGARGVSNDADAAVRRFFETHAEPNGNLTVYLPQGDGQPLLLQYGRRGQTQWLEYAEDGQLRQPRLVAEDDQSGNFVDYLHRKGGLPVPLAWAEPVIGIVSLLYALALVSGVVVLLPSLVKDLFYLRLGANLKRKWLDVHNLLGVTSLPFHIVIAVSAAVFGLHDLIYLAQDKLVYREGLRATAQRDMPPRPQVKAPPAQWMAPSQVVQTLQAQAPGFTTRAVVYSGMGTPRAALFVAGDDTAHFQRGARVGYVSADPVSGRIFDRTYQPGAADGAVAAVVVSLFSLHFGSFAGDLGRVLYVLLGLSGALIFYTGNLLWIESRTKRRRQQPGSFERARHVRVVSALTVGVCLGAAAGLPVALTAARWLAPWVDDLNAVHQGVFYAVFVAAIAWAQWRGTQRAAPALLWLAALGNASVPLTALLLGADALPWPAALQRAHEPGFWLLEGLCAALAVFFGWLAVRQRRAAAAAQRAGVPAPGQTARPLESAA